MNADLKRIQHVDVKAVEEDNRDTSSPSEWTTTRRHMENTPVGFVVGTGRGKGGTRRRNGAVGTGGFRFSGDVPKHIRDSGFKRVGCNVGT